MTGAAVLQTIPQDFTPSLFDAFVDWIDRGKQTTRTYLNHLKQFFAWTRYREILRPIREDIAAFRDWLLGEHEAIQMDTETAQGWKYRTDKATGKPLLLTCSPNTTAQYLRSVKQFFKWTGTAGLYPDIAANVRPPKVAHDVHRRDALTVEEVLTVESSIKENSRAQIETAATEKKDTEGRKQRQTEQGARLLAMYELAVTAGLRTCELSRANVKDFEEKNGQAWLYIWGKGRTEADQKKPLAPKVAAVIKEYLTTRTDGGRLDGNAPLFVATGNRNGGRRIKARTIGSMIKAALRAAGLNSKRISAHSLRHTTGTALHQLTGNLYTVQRYMRHANPSTTEVYLHVKTDQEEADLAARLYDLYHGEARTDERARLEALLDRLTPSKIGQLADLAAAMA